MSLNWLPIETTVAPATEPLTLAEAAAQCKVEVGDDDSEVQNAANAARAHVEAVSGTRLVTQTVKMRADRFCDTMRLPVMPVQSITSVEYLDSDGATQTLATTVYDKFLFGLRPFIALASGQSWPSTLCNPAAVTITAVVGYGAAAAVPDDVKRAVRLLTGDFYDRRADTVTESGVTPSSLPNGVMALIANHRNFGF